MKLNVLEFSLLNKRPSPLTWSCAATKYLKGNALGDVQVADRIADWLAASFVMGVTAVLTSPPEETTVKTTRMKAGFTPEVSSASAKNVLLFEIASERCLMSGRAFHWIKLACAGGGVEAVAPMSV